MRPHLIRNLVLISTASLGLAACTDGYGYGGVSYGNSYYDDYYGGGYYGGSPYYGWYDGWYYPGNGYYIYDRRGGRRTWDDNHRRHWEGRRGSGNWNGNNNWNNGAIDNGRPPWRGNRDGNWNGRRDGNWQGGRGTGTPRVTNPGGNGQGRWNGNRGGGNWQGRNSGQTVTPTTPNPAPSGNRPPWRGRQN